MGNRDCPQRSKSSKIECFYNILFTNGCITTVKFSNQCGATSSLCILNHADDLFRIDIEDCYARTSAIDKQLASIIVESKIIPCSLSAQQRCTCQVITSRS